ncbi:MAG: His/Gly/Thr/Pro-type tRNA ligase C-terminal domain-containing protein [Bacillota bacterium]
MDYLDRSLKSQLKFADKSGFRFVIFLGEDEWKQQEINFKDLTTGEQARFPLEEVVSNILRYTREVLKNNG